MAEYILDVVNETSKLDWAFPFQRTGAFPIDRTALFSSLADATAYARGDGSDERELGGASYVGQIISVYEAAEGETPASVNAYIITTDRGLLKLAATTASGDFAADIAALQAKVNELETTVGSHTTSISELETAVGDLEAKDLLIDANIKAINGDIDTIETALEDIYTKGETDSAISTAIAAVDHLKREIYDTTDEIDLTASDADEYIYMVSREDGTYEEYMVLNGKLEKVGDWTVDLSDYAKTSEVETLLADYALTTDLEPYAKTADVNTLLADYAKPADIETALEPYAKTADVETELAKKVAIEEGKSLVSNDLIAKLEGIEAGAQVNYITAVTSDFTVTEGELAIVSVAQDKITGLTKVNGDAITLAEALDGKVDKEEGSRLLTEDEAKKLAKLVMDESGNVGISGTINAENVIGLDTLLEKKVDAVEGMGLSANNFTTELLTKLTNIEEGANVNVIENVAINGTNLAITDKTVNIPVASASAVGVVKSVEAENGVIVDAEGAMSVHSLNVNKLTQTNGEWLILNGGSASLEQSV